MQHDAQLPHDALYRTPHNRTSFAVFNVNDLSCASLNITLGDHHFSQRSAVRVLRTGKRIGYPLRIRGRPVLAKLEFALDAGDRNLEKATMFCIILSR